MKSYNTYYSKENVQKLPIDKINSSKAILIQLFSGICDKNFLNNIIQELNSTFPNAVIIGATTDGEISNSKISTHKTIISISTFEKTSLKSFIIEDIDSMGSYNSGKTLALKLFEDDTKVLITFCDGLHTNGEEFLKGIDAVSSDIVVAGGLAGDNAKFENTFILSNNGAMTKGAVAIALNSKELTVTTDYKLDWIPIGKKLKITHADKNRVYSIDNIKAADVYKHYLGKNVYDKLPKTGIEFPLIAKQNNINIARAVITKYEDGSLDFAGNVNAGEYYQFGFANLDMILQNAPNVSNNFDNLNIESIFIFSCMARRRFLQQLTEVELQPFSDIAPVSGFFTYGEFFHKSNSSKLLNQTMTAIGFSENHKKSKITNRKNITKSTQQDEYHSTLTALSHLLTVSSSELEELNSTLQRKKQPIFAGGPVINYKLELKKEPHITYVTPNAIEISEYSAKELLNQDIKLLELIHPEDLRSFFKTMQKHLKSNNISVETEFRIVTKHGKIKHVYNFISAERDKKSKTINLHGYLIDITDRKNSEEKIKFLAYHDALTSLPNRSLLKNRLVKAIQNTKKDNYAGALLFLDLNRFKNINDTLGHSVGDLLLQKVAKRLKSCIRTDDTLARLGGDEFVILLPNLNKKTVFSHIRIISKRITKVLDEPFEINGNILHTSTSIGAAVFPEDGETPDDILKHADTAMYLAKKSSNEYLKFYRSIMKESITNDLTIENDLRFALKNSEFQLLYQPQVNISTGEIIGAEALIRWNHQSKGIISPLNFIPIAENTGLILPIGEWVIKTACKKIKYLQDRQELPKSFKKISVNISSKQFQQPNFVQNVINIILETKIDPHYLELELTEGTLIENIEEAIKKINMLKQTGIKFSIDDFGTGYSSLSYLKKLPIDIIKIDKSFIDNIDKDKNDAIIAETIIQMSKNLKLDVIAEGVETLEHLNFLQEKECNAYQGYYFSKPVSFNDFENLLVQRNLNTSLNLINIY